MMAVMGLDDEIPASADWKTLLTTRGPALEELEHRITFVLARVEHIGFDAHPALRGNRQGGIIYKGNLGFG